MPQTTWPIRSTIWENKSSRVYWLWAYRSNSVSTDAGFKACSSRPRTITATGLSLTKRSKTELRSMAASLPGLLYPYAGSQFSETSGTLTGLVDDQGTANLLTGTVYY